MPELELQFIGTGNAFAPGGLCWNGFVVNGRFLFEAPPQALQSLNLMGIDPNGLDAVVLNVTGVGSPNAGWITSVPKR